jgi:hypothetical protein
MLRVVALIVASLASMPAAAVSCGGQQSVRQAYLQADDVFSAHVEEIYAAPAFGRETFHFAKLRILRVWKGGLTPGDAVSTTAEDSVVFESDGFVPLEGSDVLIYTGGSEPFRLSTCSRSGPLESTQDIPTLDRLARKRIARGAGE